MNQYTYKSKTSSLVSVNSLLYKGEYILKKLENIKSEDSNKSIEKESSVYITNIRILSINSTSILDIPFQFISSKSIHTPLFGSPYICLYLSYKNNPPKYFDVIYNNTSLNIILPSYLMLKFKEKNQDLDKSMSYIDLSIKNNEYNQPFLFSTTEKDIENEKVSNTSKENSYTSLVSGLGLQRIVNMIDKKNQENSNFINFSFNDLSSLKQNISNLVKLGTELKAKVGDSLSKDDEKGKEISNLLQRIGFIDPITKEIAGKSYIKEISSQVESFLSEYFKINEGIISIIDVYCIYNRARGINTISPSDMKSVVDYLKVNSNKINIKTMSSITIIYSDDFSIGSVYKKLKTIYSEQPFYSFNINEVKSILKVKNISLCKLIIEDMVENGYLCIDESDFDIRYFNNMIVEMRNVK